MKLKNQHSVLISLLLLGSMASFSPADEAVPQRGEARWWKGNLHTHSFWSDGDDFPEMIAEWYRSNDYNFLALSDHNVLGDGLRFMKHSEVERRGGVTALPKYIAKFGKEWVESKGKPATDEYAIRLKPLHEFRSLVEERGKFIMIQAEEISDSAGGLPVHMNATNLREFIEPAGGATVREVISNNLRSLEEQNKKTGRKTLIHLNHPNFGWAITAEDIAAVIQERFFEVYNGHPVVGHNGDESHPSVERLWDIANTIRIGELNAPIIFGVATDDSHNYHGKPNGASSGRGWVMVRSRYLSPEHLIRAMKAGDFYASSGVRLDDVSYDATKKELHVAIDAAEGETYEIQFVGTRKNYDRTTSVRKSENGTDRLTKKYSNEIGVPLATHIGPHGTYRMRGDELYVRAVVTSSAAHENPSFDCQHKQAWTQPVQPHQPSVRADAE